MVKGMDLPLIWNTWLMGSQASSIYCSKEIYALILEIRKNFSRPQFRSAFTVTGSWRAIMSSSSCSRSRHVRDILLKGPCKTNKRKSKILDLMRNWKKFHQKLCNRTVFLCSTQLASVPPTLKVKLPSCSLTFNAGFEWTACADGRVP